MYNGTDALKFALKFLYSTRQKLNRTKQIGNSALLKSWTKKWNRRGEKKKKEKEESRNGNDWENAFNPREKSTRFLSWTQSSNTASVMRSNFLTFLCHSATSKGPMNIYGISVLFILNHRLREVHTTTKFT